ncbi:MAG: PQQ-binding-like beta-propeller repeat protein [Pirellulales bacterium]|nr:PQQ-binding-like beta-propeller repeat protein [Pirellulales bacterium]
MLPTAPTPCRLRPSYRPRGQLPFAFSLVRWLCEALSLGLVLPSSTLPADDWPQWRGPHRDGVWREDGIVDRFETSQLAPRWRVPIGPGYSGPTVADGRVFVTDRVREPKQIERVHCFDAASGAHLWTHAYDCTYMGVGYEAGPRASVSIDQGMAYSLGAMGHLVALEAESGRVVWQHDLNREYRIRMPIWGIAASPLVEGGLVIVQIGGEGACLVAFDQHTGEERWRALDDEASYSAPIVIQQAGQRVLVCWTGDNVAGLDPATGRVYWKHPFQPTRMVIAIATPVVDRNRLFVTSFYDGSLMLRLADDRPAVDLLWRRLGPDEQHTDALHSIISTPLLLGEHVYGVDSYGELRCLDAQTGDRIWESLEATPRARWSNIHMVRNGDNIWMFNERGELIIARLSPQGYHEISRAKLIEPTREQLNQRGGVCWAHPAYASRHVFVRNDQELRCVSLEAR